MMDLRGSILSFDFVQSELKKHYSAVSPQNAYREVKKYLLKYGFEHLKDSDYKHTDIGLETAYDIVVKFAKDNHWFAVCLSKFNISPNIPIIDISPELKSLCSDLELDDLKEEEEDLEPEM
ncbi:hypothetical protein [Bacteroides heparinolyticus]|uniref:hypothetical protein n=1 Tax=Prevotella heparinolytica TaxID=28113 RepID=UPI0035A17642